jgi:hypothetical protein
MAVGRMNAKEPIVGAKSVPSTLWPRRTSSNFACVAAGSGGIETELIFWN